jgi:hypothetical protein
LPSFAMVLIKPQSLETWNLGWFFRKTEIRGNPKALEQRVVHQRGASRSGKVWGRGQLRVEEEAGSNWRTNPGWVQKLRKGETDWAGRAVCEQTHFSCSI